MMTMTFLLQIFEKLCEPVQELEPNCMNGMVTGDMTRDHVVDMIMDQVKSLENNASMRLLDGYYKVSFQRMPIA